MRIYSTALFFLLLTAPLAAQQSPLPSDAPSPAAEGRPASSAAAAATGQSREARMEAASPAGLPSNTVSPSGLAPATMQASHPGLQSAAPVTAVTPSAIVAAPAVEAPKPAPSVPSQSEPSRE